ncbi:HD domain-containing protein [Kitasatospora azatica]|uniref:metal-dependent phosphohydrolase n=1 Tax=Kitasatospora azatica TaxID=58347 RepID=UPI00056BC5DB|nr:metal-dependent phosphohydrolase [Kitasatospora azatica]
MSLSPFPDSPLARAADQLLRTACPPTLVGHSHRTYRFGAALLDGQRRAFDAEALFIGAALHDLALVEPYDDPDTPFELHGSRLAEQELLAGGARPELVELVRDAIALHLDIATADDPRPEVAAVHLGAAVDVVGLRLDQLPPALVAEVLELHPRQGFSAYVSEVLTGQAKAKPGSKIAALIQRADFLRLVAAAPFHD